MVTKCYVASPSSCWPSKTRFFGSTEIITDKSDRKELPNLTLMASSFRRSRQWCVSNGVFSDSVLFVTCEARYPWDCSRFPIVWICYRRLLLSNIFFSACHVVQFWSKCVALVDIISFHNFISAQLFVVFGRIWTYTTFTVFPVHYTYLWKPGNWITSMVSFFLQNFATGILLKQLTPVRIHGSLDTDSLRVFPEKSILTCSPGSFFSFLFFLGKGISTELIFTGTHASHSIFLPTFGHQRSSLSAYCLPRG